MPKVILKVIPALVFWGTFLYVLLNVPYPDSLPQANLTQFGLFFATFYLAVTFTLNAFLKNILLSLSISLGIILLLILKALDSLNFVTSLLVLISVGLLSSYFKKSKNKSLTKLPKIPKLT